jgi:hypothetical protein
MRILSFICGLLLILAIAKLPIGYYTILRILVTISACAIAILEFKNKLNVWVIVFGLIAILFNPIIPVYFHHKSVWIPIDLICGILFFAKTIIKTNNVMKKDS